MSDETGGGGGRRNEAIQLERRRTRSGVTEVVRVGRRRQICEPAVNGFSILELNYAICLLGLVLPLCQGFKLQNALWALMSFFLRDNTAAHKERFNATFQSRVWKIRADLCVLTLQRNLKDSTSHR